MRVQHNIAAMNSYRNYFNNTGAINKNLEKLSSGYKINRAGDDAAGLAISEKMRAQITGLEGAQKNAKDGIRLVQTAEGALTEVHSMLNRMFSLAEQSANGTYEGLDRGQLQKEVDQLRDEINRIADSANFNGLNLLDGSLSASGSSGSANKVTADLSKLGVDLVANASSYKAVKGKYKTGNLVSTAATPAATSASYAKGDVFEFSLNYTDSEGNEKTSTIRIKAVGSAANKNDNFVLEYGSKTTEFTLATAIGTAKKLTSAEMDKLIAKAIEKQDGGEIKSLFTVTAGSGVSVGSGSSATKNGLSFEAKAGGDEGAKVTGYSLTKILKATDENETVYNSTTAYNQSKVVKYSSVVQETRTAMNAGKAYNFNSNARVWDARSIATAGTKWNADSKLEDAIFEVNGKKFVFIAASTALTDSELAALRDAGVDDYVQLATTPTAAATKGAVVTATAVGKMAEKIEKATGLDLVLGSVSNGSFVVASRTTWTTAGDKWVMFNDGASTSKGKAGGMTLQIGDTAADYNQLTVDIGDVHVKALKIHDIDISKQDGAQAAMDKLKSAINDVSSIRGTLGATQNRLEHTINNLSVMQENIQDAESNIRDTDVADEMMKYTKNSILVQSAQAMLAQANQQPQGVLQLLQ